MFRFLSRRIIASGALVLALGSCSSDQAYEENYDDDDLSVAEPSYGNYELTSRGVTHKWDASQVYFSLHQARTEHDGVYSIAARMTWQDAPDNAAADAAFTLYTDKPIIQEDFSLAADLVHIHTFSQELDCFKNPSACIDKGFGLIGGTTPKGGLNSLSGGDDDIHTQAGTLQLTDLRVISNDGYVIKGTVSGKFNLSGINTNASKPNQGNAHGHFKDAPFETLNLRR